MTHLSLGAGHEFDRIRQIIAALGAHAGQLGDDCAVLEPGPGKLVASTDVSVEQVHFRRDWLAPEEIGWRATASAFSDLAAEGATPLAALVALVVPAGASDDLVTGIMRGAGDAAAAAGTVVAGGDLSRGPVLALAVTVLGTAVRPVTRAGAQPGDGLWVTGALGGARAALARLVRGEEPPAEARRAFARPEPRIAAGRWLAACGARAMLDISDGLGGDAGHLAAASAVHLDIDLDLVPRTAGVAEVAESVGVAPGVVAGMGGEDYELLCALPASFDGVDVARFTAETGLPLTRIGWAAGGEGVTFRSGGAVVTITGYDHFRP